MIKNDCGRGYSVEKTVRKEDRKVIEKRRGGKRKWESKEKVKRGSESMTSFLPKHIKAK